MCAGAPLGDFFAFDFASVTWIVPPAAAGLSPPPRYGHGFAAAGGRLYVHGGSNATPGMAAGGLLAHSPPAVLSLAPIQISIAKPTRGCRH